MILARSESFVCSRARTRESAKIERHDRLGATSTTRRYGRHRHNAYAERFAIGESAALVGLDGSSAENPGEAQIPSLLRHAGAGRVDGAARQVDAATLDNSV
jgi:hypothetical protein